MYVNAGASGGEGINFLGLERQSDVCLSIQVLGVDSGSLGEQQVLLTAEPSLYPPPPTLLILTIKLPNDLPQDNPFLKVKPSHLFSGYCQLSDECSHLETCIWSL